MIQVGRALFGAARTRERGAPSPAGVNPTLGKQIVVVGGCARSGTTALATLLNRHPACAIGLERYGRRFRQGGLAPDLFTPERFADIREGDTHYMEVRRNRDDVAGKLADATVVGDKFPDVSTAYEAIFRDLEGAKVVFILRNPLSVVESYQRRADNPTDVSWPAWRDAERALKEWNNSLKRTLARLPDQADRIAVTTYEKVFYDKRAFDRVCAFLDIEPLPPAQFDGYGHHERRSPSLSDQIRRTVFLTARTDLYSQLSAYALDADLETPSDAVDIAATT